MAESKDNYVISGLSGAIGNLLTFRQRAGKTVISKFPRASSIPPTPKLRSVRSDFATCIAIAKAAIKDPVLKAKYQAAAKGGQTAFNVATSEALKRLQSAENKSSETGIIENSFKKPPVTISVHQPSGELLEKGNATVDTDNGEWLYRCTKAGPLPAGSRIAISTTDLLGNTILIIISLD